MNKKVLSAILFSALFAGTGTFTSCIDNDEPAGIEELRGAKAELIRAKVAVEQAQASLTLAQAEVEKAKAAKKMAEAEIEKAKAAIKAAKAEAAELENESIAAELELTIAKNQMQLDSLQVIHQTIMNDLKTSLALSQRSYEIMLAQIEIAKTVGSSDQYVTVGKLQHAVKRAQRKVAFAQEEVDAAQAEYDFAVAFDETHGELYAARLESLVATAEEELKNAQEELALWEGYMENAETADWIAEVATLTDSIDALVKDSTETRIALDKALVSDTLMALWDAVRNVELATADSVYGHKYFGDEFATTLYKNDNGTTTLSDGEEEIAEEDAKNAEIDEEVLAEIESKIYDDKQELASFTAETKHFLDTIAASVAGEVNGLKTKSDEAVDKWKKALEAYNNADPTMSDLAEDAEEIYNDPDATDEEIAKALLDYLTVAKANGATLNKIPVQQKDSVLIEEPGSTPQQVVMTKHPAFALEDALAVLADTVKMRAAIYQFDVNFLGVMDEDDEELTYEHEGVAGKVYGTDKKQFDLKYYENVIAEAAPARGEYEEGVDPDENTLLGKLQIASKKAFGDADQYLKELVWEYEHVAGGYLHVMPDTADVKNLESFNVADREDLGAFGKYVLADVDGIKEYALTYKDRIKNLEAAIPYWEATYKTLEAKFDAQDVLYQAAVDAKDLYIEENITPLYKELGAHKFKIARIQYVMTTLVEAIELYLPEEFKEMDDSGYDTENEPIENLIAFVDFLDEAIAEAKENVETCEDNLADAKLFATLIENGKTYVELAQEKLDEAIANLEAKQAKLDEALANLAKGLEIIAAVNAAE